MDREVWRAVVHRFIKSQTQLKRLSMDTWIHVYVWLSPFSIHLKLSQHSLSAEFQYKIKGLKNKIKGMEIRDCFLLIETLIFML